MKLITRIPHFTLLFSFFSLLTFLSPHPLMGVNSLKDHRIEFSQTYDPSDEFFNYRLHILKGEKEVYKTRRVSAIFAPDKKIPQNLDPQTKIVDFNNDGLEDILVLFPKVDATMTGISVLAIQQTKPGEFSSLNTKEDLEDEDFLKTNDYQSGLLTSNSGFHPSNILYEEGTVGITDKSGKIHFYRLSPIIKYTGLTRYLTPFDKK